MKVPIETWWKMCLSQDFSGLRFKNPFFPQLYNQYSGTKNGRSNLSSLLLLRSAHSPRIGQPRPGLAQRPPLCQKYPSAARAQYHLRHLRSRPRFRVPLLNYQPQIQPPWQLGAVDPKCPIPRNSADRTRKEERKCPHPLRCRGVPIDFPPHRIHDAQIRSRPPCLLRSHSEEKTMRSSQSWFR